MLAGADDTHAGITGARGDGRSAQDQAENGYAGGGLHALVKADDMAAGYMAQFMGHDALHFIGGVGGVDQAGIEIDPLTAGDKGVDLVIVDQHDFDFFGIQFGYLNQRCHHIGEQRLGFGVAQDRLRGKGLHAEGNKGQEGDQKTG